MLDFEVLVCKLICRKDTGPLLEATILPKLTEGLSVIASTPIHIYEDLDCGLCCKFEVPTPDKSPRSNSVNVDLYITGDLAFQSMALGKESMASHWCTLCKAHKSKFLDDDYEVWTMEELTKAGKEAGKTKGEPKLGIKQEPWWPFIPITHYIVPLLHCEIGVGNQLLQKLRDIANEHLENMTLDEVSVRSSIPVLKNIIAVTAKKRDECDACNENGKKMKSLQRSIAANICKQEYYQTAGERQDIQHDNMMAKIAQLKAVLAADEIEFK